jgi:ParB-like nuclease domain
MPPRLPDAVEHWPLDRLIPYARNARTHSEDQVAQIAASIVEFGWLNPVLIDDAGSVIAGHGRLLAAGPCRHPCARRSWSSPTEGFDEVYLASIALMDAAENGTPRSFMMRRCASSAAMSPEGSLTTLGTPPAQLPHQRDRVTAGTAPRVPACEPLRSRLVRPIHRGSRWGREGVGGRRPKVPA